MTTYIGTAGWNIPSYLKNSFSQSGTHLQQYAEVFNAVEINSAFYRNHKPETYKKWASCVPDDFRVSVKLHKDFIHTSRFREFGPQLKEVIDSICCLKEKLDVILVQLPPSLDFDYETVQKFITSFRNYYSGGIVWEPRHISWSCTKAMDLLKDYGISKVCADPEPCPSNDALLNNDDCRYYRLHGTPEIYKSRYSPEFIKKLSAKIKSNQQKVWCIFDNTTFGYATENALELKCHVEGDSVLRNKGSFVG